MAHSTGFSGAGFGSMCLEKELIVGEECHGLCDAFFEVASLWARSGRHPVVQALFSSQKSVTARPAHSAEDWRRHALFMAKPSKVASRLRLDAALEAAEDGHVAWPCHREGSTLVLLCSGSSRRPMWP